MSILTAIFVSLIKRIKKPTMAKKSNNKKVINVTEKELAQILFETKPAGVTFASILQMTSPKCTKKSRITGEPNPYQQVTKISKVSVILNSDYEKAVTNQLAKEDKEATDYKKGINTMPLTFGTNNQFIGIFNGDFVLQYRPNDNVKPQSVFFADGKRKNKEHLAQYLPVETPATNQGTTREIFWRKLYLSNVLRMAINGKTYNLISE